jgi:hypothetical protein
MLLTVIASLWVVLTSGCVHALHLYNQPSQEKLRLQSSSPQQYTIRVADKSDYPVAADGRVVVDVPQLERGCATYLFCVVRVKDSSPYDVHAIQVKKHDRAVRKLSLNDLAKLAIDAEGYRVVKVE